METKKAGCILINKETKSIALIYREKQKDYSFPKGHLEKNEDFVTCAIRETAEETKRVAVIVDKHLPYVERYTTPRGEKCVCYMYIAIDNGSSDNTSEDTHEVVWTPFERVEDALSYESLKVMWRELSNRVKSVLLNK